MDKDKVREIDINQIQELDQNQIKYMTLIDGTIAIINSDEKNENYPKKIQENMVVENEIIKETNEENDEINEKQNEQNQNFIINPNKQNIINENEIDNQVYMDTNQNNESEINNQVNMDTYQNNENEINNQVNMDTNQNNENEINNQLNMDTNQNNKNNIDNNVMKNNMNNFEVLNENQYETNEEEEINENENMEKEMIEKNTEEKFDGADNYNNSNLDNKEINQINEQQFEENVNDYNNNIQIQHNNFQDNNDSEPNINNDDFMIQNEQNEIINNNNNNDNIQNQNNINKIPQKLENQEQIQSKSNNSQYKNSPPQQDQEEYYENNIPNESQNKVKYKAYEIINDSNNNYFVNSNNMNEKMNYKIITTNNYKIVDDSSELNNISNEPKIYIKNNNDEKINNNYSQNMNYKKDINNSQLNQKIIPEILNQKFISTGDIKVVNAIPLENYIQTKNKKYQAYQNMANKNEKEKIFVATDTNSSNIIPQQKKGQIQIQFENQNINEDYRQQNLNENQNNIPNVAQIEYNNINNNQNKIPYRNQIQYNNIKDNQQFEKRNNFYTNVLYPKEGYGNSEIIQNQLKNNNKKKKKKKKLYIRKKNPLVLQHFEVQIQDQKEEILSEIPQQNQINYAIHQNQDINLNNNINTNINNTTNNNVQNIKRHSTSNEKNKVPPVINKYQNPHNYNNIFYHPKGEYVCTCSIPPQYHPIIPNNRIPIQLYSDEQELNYGYRSPPKRTVISITPMRTIKKTNSPFPENIEFSYNNPNRYYRNEGNRQFRTLSPINYPIRYERMPSYEYENIDENYENNFYNEGGRNHSNIVHPQRRDERIMIYEGNDDDDIRDNNGYELYRRGQRMVRSNY